MQNRIIVSSEQIEVAWSHLTRDELAVRSLPGRTAKRMAKNGWVRNYEVHDALEDMISWKSWPWFANIEEMEGHLELGGVADFRREWKYAEEISGQMRLSSSDVLQYFWWLERLGFPLDLGLFPDELELRLPRTDYLSEKDFNVLLYKSGRFRQPPVELVTEDAEAPFASVSVKTLATSSTGSGFARPRAAKDISLKRGRGWSTGWDHSISNHRSRTRCRLFWPRCTRPETTSLIDIP